EAGVDSSFFYLPPIEEEYGNPVLGAGDVFSMFNDRPEVRAVMEYLATPDAARGWIEAGGFISPNNAVPAEWYGNYVDQAQADILQNATTLRFDASDLMPAEVGTGTFWSGMVEWVSGEDMETVFQQIEDSWPSATTGVGGTGSSDDGQAEATDHTAAYEHLARAEAGEFAGSTVTIFGKWTEAEGDNFVNTLAPFAERTGIDIQYEGSSEFETLVTVRVEGGDAPDIAG